MGIAICWRWDLHSEIKLTFMPETATNSDMGKTKRKLTRDELAELTKQPTTREGKRLDAAKPTQYYKREGD